MGNKRILFVDDDEKLLNGILRQQGDRFDLTTALGGVEAIDTIQHEGPFAVVVSDMRMPQMNGIELLKRVRAIAPDTVRMMFTGFAELNSTIEAINEGNIFRFIAKPCCEIDMANSLNAALRQHALIEAEKELVEGTLRGSVNILSEMLSLVSPLAFSQTTRVRGIVDGLLKQIKIENQWQLEIAAMLSSLGCVTIPNEVLEKKLNGEAVSRDEEKIFANHPRQASDLIKTIPRLEQVAEIIRCQQMPSDEKGVDGKPVPVESRILKLAIEFDRKERSSKSSLHAFREFKDRNHDYGDDLIDALERFIKEERSFSCEEVRLHEITEGMILAEDLRRDGGTLLMSQGQRLSASAIRLLENYAKNSSLGGRIKVITPNSKRVAITRFSLPRSIT